MPKLAEYSIFGPTFKAAKINFLELRSFIFFFCLYRLEGNLEKIITARFKEIKTFDEYSV